MAENLITALEITVAGMALVFGAIVLLWGVMALLVRVTGNAASASDAPTSPPTTPPQRA